MFEIALFARTLELLNASFRQRAQFGILLLRERTISTKGSILGGQQFLLALVVRYMIQELFVV